MTQINLIEQIYPLNGDHRIQTVKPKWIVNDALNDFDNIEEIKCYAAVLNCIPLDKIDYRLYAVRDSAPPLLSWFSICIN